MPFRRWVAWPSICPASTCPASTCSALVTTLALAVLCSPTGRGHAADSQSAGSAPLPPTIAEASEEAERSMSGIRLPAEWRIELFAAEPDVANIVAFDIDHRGRFYVCETFRQNRGVTDNREHDQRWLLADLAASTVQDRIDYHKRLLGEAAATYSQHDDRIRRLEDTTGDGRADRSVVLADGFHRLEEGTGAGVLVRGESVFYTCIPRLWRLVDENDDGQADARHVLSEGYGVRVAFRGHDLHGLTLGPDGRLYFSIGDRGYHVTADDGRVLADPASGAVFRCEPDGSGLEVFCGGLRNPQELAFNDLGDLFTVDNNSDSGDQSRIVHLLEGGDSGWRMHYQYLPDRGPFNRQRIWEPLHEDQPAHIVPPVANLTDGPSGLAHYPGTGFGEALRDAFLICDFRGGASNSGIRSFWLKPNGAFYSLDRHDQPIWSVLATDVAFGPDGAIYLSDWVDGWNGTGKGRIYRVAAAGHRDDAVVADVSRWLASDWASHDAATLRSLLDHPDRRVRLEAQWALADRRDLDTLLAVVADHSLGMFGRLHALWGADQIARRDRGSAPAVFAALRPLLDDPQAEIRAAAAKTLGERGDTEAVPALIDRIDDPAPRVRYFAIRAATKLAAAAAEPAVIEQLVRNQNRDPAIRHAATRYLGSTLKSDRLEAFKAHASEGVRRAAVAALRGQASERVAAFLDDPSPRVRREAAMAIHDVPIPAAAEPLADRLAQPARDAEDPLLLRRALNAAYRLGTEKSAADLAAFAADLTAPESLRLEALAMLGEWAPGDPRNRVTGHHDPIPPRPHAPAVAALTPRIDELMASQEVIRERTIEVAATLGIRKIVPQLVKRVSDPQQRARVRAAALRGLAQMSPQDAVNAARNIHERWPPELMRAALQTLARHDAARSVGLVVQGTRSESLSVRQTAWDALARLDHPAARAAIRDAAAEYLAGTLDADVELNVLEAVQAAAEEDIRGAIARHRQELAGQDPLGPWLASLRGGDPVAGRRLFFEKSELSCVRCHRAEGNGGNVGPDLTGIADKRDRRYLLESICLPDAAIAEGYETAVIVDEDGRVFSGIVRGGDRRDVVELLQADGTTVLIDPAEIVERKRGPSAMPGDLVRLMSDRELRDLVAYLASLQSSR